MADPPICHLLLVLSCMLLHLVIHTPGLAQLEPRFSPGEAPNDNASPPAPPSSLVGSAAPPSDSPTIDFPGPAQAPTPLSPSGSADTPSPTGSIVTASTSSPPSQAAPAPAPAPAPALDPPPVPSFESTHSPPAPPISPLLAPPPYPWHSSLPSSSSSSFFSSKEGLSTAKKAGISIGVLLSVAVAGLVTFIIKRRRHNIHRSQYGRSQYRGYHGDTI